MKLLTDEELKQHLKDLQIDIIKTILHPYSFGKIGCCVTCDYCCIRKCWLCDQCESCCNLSEKQLEMEESFREDQKQQAIFSKK